MKTHILGFSLIILSLITWGLILNVPLSVLGIKSLYFAMLILFIASAVFWVGVILLVIELLWNLRALLKKARQNPDRNTAIAKPGSVVRINYN
jgi:hypothetical protein